MASSSKGPRAASRKKSNDDKARVVAVKRAEPLPRKVTASASRRKPAMQPESDAPRAKTPRASGRTSRKPAKPARSIEAEMVTASEPDVPAAVSAAPPTPADEAVTMIAAEAPALEVPAAVGAELIVEASQIVEETALPEAPLTRAPHQGKRALVTAVSRLLSTLLRWTRAR
jgi:hypothetical protein